MRLRQQRPDQAPVTAEGPADRDLREVVVTGAHGGAGTTTLAALLGAGWDMGSVLDPDPAYAPVRAHGRPLVVVCRDSVPAARHATRVVTALHACGERISALAIVSDGAGGEPADASARFALLEGRVGGTVRIPFVPALRLVDDPADVALPAKARRALAHLTDLITNRPQAPTGPLPVTTAQEAPCPF